MWVIFQLLECGMLRATFYVRGSYYAIALNKVRSRSKDKTLDCDTSRAS